MKLKQKIIIKIFIKIKNCFILVIFHEILLILFFDPVNKNVIGEMTDELKGQTISEFAIIKINK